MMTTVQDRFWAKVVEDPSGCWRYTGAHSNGYGVFTVGNGSDKVSFKAHRFAYEHMVADLPEGLPIDHVKTNGCQFRDCVRPDHLEPVTSSENNRRSWAGRERASHCPSGHRFTAENTYINPSSRSRKCRKCLARMAREAYHRKGW